MRLILFLVLVFSLPLALAHEPGEVKDSSAFNADFENKKDEVMNQRTGNVMNVMLPWLHFAKGDWKMGMFMVFIWYVLLKGLYELSILVFGKFIVGHA